MNKVRRKVITEIKEEIEALRDKVLELLEEEEDYRDNMPENLQSSERYAKAEMACDNLSASVDSLDEAINCLEESCE